MGNYTLMQIKERKSMKNKKTCFVIAPIGDKDTTTRHRSDQIMKYVIEPIVVELGYATPRRSDHISAPGMVTTQIIECIVEDDLVIADLTGANANVFYELAIRHAIRKPVVQLIQKGDRIPFDVLTSRTIEIDHTNLDSVEEAKQELRRQILAVEKDPNKIDNPISMSLDLRALKLSEDPEKRSIAELTEDISKIRAIVQTLSHNFDVLEKLKMWETVMERLNILDQKNVSGFYDLDDIASKVDDVESKVEDLKSEITEVKEKLNE